MSEEFNLNQVIASERELERAPKRGMFLLDPRLKLFLLFLVIFLNIGLAINIISGILLCLGLLTFLWTRPPLGRTTFFLLAPLLTVIITVIGFSIGFGVTPIFELWGVSVYKEGLIQGGGVALRVYCDVTWLALTFITTPFAQILSALRWYKVPDILVDTLGIMYRYSFLLYEEFLRMHVAATTRGGRTTTWKSIQSVSRIGAQIFLRVFDRSERIYWAQFARGGQKDA